MFQSRLTVKYICTQYSLSGLYIFNLTGTPYILYVHPQVTANKDWSLSFHCDIIGHHCDVIWSIVHLVVYSKTVTWGLGGHECFVLHSTKMPVKNLQKVLPPPLNGKSQVSSPVTCRPIDLRLVNFPNLLEFSNNKYQTQVGSSLIWQNYRKKVKDMYGSHWNFHVCSEIYKFRSFIEVFLRDVL